MNLILEVKGTGILTVEKAPLTITVNDVSRIYGEPNPELSVSYDGFVNGEDENALEGTLTLAYDKSINDTTSVNTYNDKTTASGLTAKNYTIVYVPGNVTINKIPVNISAGTARKSYLTAVFDRAVEGLTEANFNVKDSENKPVAVSIVNGSSDSKSYTLNGRFAVGKKYTVTVTLNGTAVNETHNIVNSEFAITPVRTSSGGGGSSKTAYTVSFETNGGSKIDSVKVTENGTVTEPTAPTKEGFDFAGWYTDKELKTKYDFSAKVTKSLTLYAAWIKKEAESDKPIAPEWENPFTDIGKSDWYYDNVKYINKNGLMNGTTNTTFAPNEPINRAMLVTILYRAEGEPSVNKSVSFADVDTGAYYANAVIWAQQNGIVSGVTENAFAPNENITREQITVILYRYAKYKGYDVSTGEDTNILSYTDAESVSEYAISAMQYAVGSGLMKGKSDTTLNPLDNATRAEIAAILQRFLEAHK